MNSSKLCFGAAEMCHPKSCGGFNVKAPSVSMGTPSHMTDFKIARQPEKQRFQGKGLSGSNLWDRVKRTDAQLEVLRRCRDSIESA